MARPEAAGESWTLPAASNGRRGVSGELLPAFGEPFPPSVGNIINPYDCRYRYIHVSCYTTPCVRTWTSRSKHELTCPRTLLAGPGPVSLLPGGGTGS